MDRIRQGIPLLFVLTSLGAMSFVAGPYLSLFSSNHRSRSYARDEISDDSSDNATTRGLMGGALGLALGLVVAFKKNEDDA
ncbi:MAG: hypothetical protein ACI9KE_005325 [Polyangiales bacterium]|jgi:hypothetical protein